MTDGHKKVDLLYEGRESVCRLVILKHKLLSKSEDVCVYFRRRRRVLPPVFSRNSPTIWKRPILGPTEVDP